MDSIFVTGITGLLGNNVVRELLDRGYFVHALVRDIQKVRIEHPNLRLFVGDITQKNGLQPAMQGCSAIIHVAATTEQNLLHYSDYQKSNFEGTKNVFQTGKDCGVRRFIHISSANTIGNGTKDRPADESIPFSLPFSKSYYARSKRETEIFLLSKKQNLDIIILNPTFMLGPHDIKPSSGTLVLMGYKTPVLFLPQGGKNFIHVKDVAIAACNALTMGKSGERYLLGNKNISFKEFFYLQKRIGGYKQWVIILPSFLLYGIGYVGDLFQMLGIKVSFTKRNLNLLCIREYYASQKAINELNLPQTPLEDTIEDTLNWFKEQNKIR